MKNESDNDTSLVGQLETIPKGLVKGQVETIQATVLLRSARTLRRVLETWGDMLSLKLQWKLSTNVGVKKLSKE